MANVDLTRRGFVQSGGAALGGAAAAVAAAGPVPARAAGAGDPRAPLPVRLEVNGQPRDLSLDPRTTLLDALREHLGLTGTKVGCNHGQCGACTVLLDGRRANACLVLAAQADGSRVVTIEGLADPAGELHPMQRAFVAHDAFQCGYCTPGQILSAVACLEEGRAGSDAEIREHMSGNLCRCGAYPNILAAVRAVRDGEFA